MPRLPLKTMQNNHILFLNIPIMQLEREKPVTRAHQLWKNYITNWGNLKTLCIKKNFRERNLMIGGHGGKGSVHHWTAGLNRQIPCVSIYIHLTKDIWASQLSMSLQ